MVDEVVTKTSSGTGNGMVSRAVDHVFKPREYVLGFLFLGLTGALVYNWLWQVVTIPLPPQLEVVYGLLIGEYLRQKRNSKGGG